jgi:hypothetical protein
MTIWPSELSARGIACETSATGSSRASPARGSLEATAETATLLLLLERIRRCFSAGRDHDAGDHAETCFDPPARDLCVLAIGDADPHAGDLEPTLVVHVVELARAIATAARAARSRMAWRSSSDMSAKPPGPPWPPPAC